MATEPSQTDDKPDSPPDEEMPDQEIQVEKEDEDDDDGNLADEPVIEKEGTADNDDRNATEEDESEGEDRQKETTKDDNKEEDIENEEDDENEDDGDDEEEDLSEAPPPPPRPKDPRSRKRRRRDRMFQDCLSVHIPIDLTADIGVAMRRTRRKRIETLSAAYPELIPEAKAAEEQPKTNNAADSKIKGDVTMDAEEGEESAPKGKKAGPAKKALPHVPRREDFANVVDYLEAKYAAGVMLNDEGDEVEPPEGEEEVAAKEADDDDEGQGSVYSQSSFLDDRDLQRGVAEQVLAQSTTTKLELEGVDDNEFFVNVGNLEVEETFATKEGYDPVDDVDDVKKPKKKRRPAVPKQASDAKSTATAESEKKKAKKPAAKNDASKDKDKESKLPTKKKAAEKDSAESPKKKVKPMAKIVTKKKTASTPAEKAAAEKKKLVDASYKNVVQLIKDMNHDDLPRRKTKERVAITCPVDKKPGDSILFANPHVPGQRLKVKIPKKTVPGAVFKVSVPVAPSAEDDDENTDYNKWSRDFYDAFGDYCSVYDEWIDLLAVVKKDSGDKDFVVYFEKRKKFDDLINDMPQDLKTPLDKTYMQKLLRRSRQNRHKRERTLKRQEERAKELRTELSDADHDDDDDDDDDDDGDNEDTISATVGGDDSDRKPAAKVNFKTQNDDRAEDTKRTVVVPERSTDFATVKFDPIHFSS